MQTNKRIVVSVTGASGALYAVRFIQQLSMSVRNVYVILSDNAAAVFETELGHSLTAPFTAEQYLGETGDYSNVEFISSKNYFSPPASGSFRHDGMVVVPCSMGTLGRIAAGISNDLTTRAADVCLKERRKLILVARDTPLNLIQLRNMVTVTEAGAVVLPAAPAFYNRPNSVEDLVDTVVARILQTLGIDQTLQPEWQVD